MICSLNEIEALCKKAARGAGLSWGLAEEAGKAARWLSAHGLPGPRLTASLLAMNDGAAYADLAPAAPVTPVTPDAPVTPMAPTAPTAPTLPMAWDGGVWRAKGGALCPLIAGAFLCDLAPKGPVALGRAAFPLLLLPYVDALARGAGGPWTLVWETEWGAAAALRVGAGAPRVDDGPEPLDDALLARFALSARIGPCLSRSSADRRPPPIDGCEIRPEVHASLEAFARRTYAPASEASRVSGAGAGLNDND